ncbi:nuclear transport factor 2 family protein [Lacihabitans sp. CCS-44]|uniref:nuclear transport factor 2 family protein n=1 Tax=Lacihabitans sp. CCS-44 TaxID=2487331 RepID=UPI0020CF45AA|nr:nuclear transport factor 2 family protein [Lacihabitans sp. CCS-44]MCP9756873.1 nuclear transport factor 2 family protein [Lacihabitans sp. CCS-44]
MKKINRSIAHLIFMLAVASVSFYSCKSTVADAPKDSENSNRIYHVTENDSVNIAMAQGYLASLLNGDGGEAEKMVTANFMAYGPAASDSATFAQVKTQWANNGTSRTKQDAGIFASSCLTVTEGPLVGDWVSLWGTYVANDNKTGKDIKVPWHSVFKIDDGKIRQTNIWFDNLAPALAMGTVVPAKK